MEGLNPVVYISKAGAPGAQPPEDLGCLVFEVSQFKI